MRTFGRYLGLVLKGKLMYPILGSTYSVCIEMFLIVLNLKFDVSNLKIYVFDFRFPPELVDLACLHLQ